MRSTIQKCVSIALAASAVVGAAAGAQEAEGRFSANLEVGIRSESNIGLSPGASLEFFQPPQFEGDAKFDDVVTRIDLGLSFRPVQTSGSELVLSATPFYEVVADLDGLSNYGLAVEATYRGEFGPEFTNPWFSATVGYTLAEFDDSRIRDGDWIEAEVAIGKRFSPVFGLSGGARYFTRSQDNKTGLCPDRGTDSGCPDNGGSTDWHSEEVFELDRVGGFLHGDIFFSDKTAMFLEYSYWDGDVTSTGPFRISGITGAANEVIMADDPAFGEWCCHTRVGFKDFHVWKVDGIQHIGEVGISHSFNDILTVGLSYLYLTTADLEMPLNGNSLDDYSNDIVELTLSAGFR